MTEIPRTLKTFGGLPLQIAAMGDYVVTQSDAGTVLQAYADGSVRIRSDVLAGQSVLEAGTFEVTATAVQQIVEEF